MRKFVLAALPAALLLVSGCSMLPNFERPAAPVPAQWPQPAAAAAQTPAVGLSWRRMLPDPRLQALIEAALANNRDLRMSVARVEEARALYGISRADRLPTVNVNAGESAARTPADLTGTGRSRTSQRWDISLGITAFELDFWGRVKSLNEAAKASYLASEEARDAFRIGLIADVAAAYFSRQELDERLALTKATLENRKDLRFLVEKRRDVGLAGDLDYLAADGAYQAIRTELASLERSRAQAENALALLVGGQPDKLPEGRRLSEQNVVGNLAVSVPSEALLARPDVRAAEQRLVAANANIGAARAAFLPRIG
ncbi:MAG: efflux transporter outer membrane subunit, partial [Thiobacillus sp.]|nr:efflux transporter outer membrane subunit [Thiobacillus sp.]